MERSVEFMIETKARVDALRSAFAALVAVVPAEQRDIVVRALQAGAKGVDEINAEQPGGESAMEELTHQMNVEFRELVRLIEAYASVRSDQTG